jgi:hypothetical protein
MINRDLSSDPTGKFALKFLVALLQYLSVVYAMYAMYDMRE